MRNIKEIKSELSTIRDAYEARVRELEAEMESVRSTRGYVKKVPAFETYYEAGRSAMPGTNPAYYEADGGSMCNGLGKSYF